jgi:hypothetical protein
MAQEKLMITGKTNEEVAFDLIAFAVQHDGVFSGKPHFSDYKEFLEEYKRALRAVRSPDTKGTDV